jgi:alginate O-acetyltransferase complex protein AlgJ
VNNAATNRFRWADGALIAIFFAVLWLPTLDFFTGLDSTRPPDENRLPAAWPARPRGNLGELQKFMAGVEAYLNDHFGFRKRLVRWSLQWKSRLFHDESGHKVIVGKNGWLYTGELQMVDHFIGAARFSDAEMEAWRKLLEQRRDWLAARGIKYLFVVAPDKQDIYPENLPDWLRNAAPAGRKTKLDQFLEYMNAHSTVAIADLRPALLAAKPDAPLYLINDVHWNALGCFIGAQEMARALRRQLPELPPLRMDDFTWTKQPTTGGDMAAYLGTDPPETNSFAFQLKAGRPMPRVQSLAPVDTVWNRHVFQTLAENEAGPEIRAVFFQDSFGVPWIRFFGQCFRRALFVQERNEFNAQTITDNHPQIVVNEMLERYFNTLDPNELTAKDPLP